MRLAQLIALWLIALALLSDVAMRYVVPAVMLARHQDAYAEAARRCHEVLANRQESEAIAMQADPTTAFALRQTSMIGLFECHDQQRLRQRLLAWGASAHALQAIDVDARMVSSATLPYVTGDQIVP